MRSLVFCGPVQPRGAIAVRAIASINNGGPAIVPADARPAHTRRRLAAVGAGVTAGNTGRRAPVKLLPSEAPGSNSGRTGTREQKSPLVLQALRAPLEAYRAALDTNALLTTALTAAAGCILSDLLAQAVAGGGEVLDLGRTLRMATYGLVEGGLAHYWYSFLDSYAARHHGPCPVRQLLAKTALEEAVWLPGTTLLFFAMVAALEGRPERALAAAFDGRLLSQLGASAVVEPLLDVVCLSCVPADCRVLFDQCTGVAFDAMKIARLGR